MKKHIYNAGPLFTKGEIRDRLDEDLKLQSLEEYSFFNPITAPCNDKAKLPSAKDIFLGDTKEVLKSDVVIANLDHEDAGVMAELGMAWGLNYAYESIKELVDNGVIKADILNHITDFGVKPKELVAVAYDLREGTAGEYDGIHVPYGRNQFVIGLIENMGEIVEDFDLAMKKL